MSSAYYLDTSALVKFYHQEAGTDQVETLFSDSASSLIISELAAVELHSTVARKLRTGEISEDAFDEILKNFADDCSQRFVVTPLDTLVVDKARGLLQKYGRVKSLRSLDALQLGAAATVKSDTSMVFVCSDTRLLEIAELEGHQIMNPESPAAT